MTTATTESPLSLLRAVSYVRVSTLDQARRGSEPEGLSIPAQREANRRRALEMGALVVAEFAERGRSSRSIERPELQRMLEYVQDRPVDFVIVHKIDSERAEHVIWAFHAYATGDWSVTRLAAELEGRGLTTRPGPNTPAGPLTVNGLHRLLRRPYYKGVVVHNGIEHPGRHEPLIDPVTWATVQDILRSRRSGERSRQHDHYLKGTVFCIECRRRLLVQHTRTQRGHYYEYYVCHRRREATCQQRKVLPIGQVEQRVEDLYRTIELNPGQRERIERIVLAKTSPAAGSQRRTTRRDRRGGPDGRGEPDQAARGLLRRCHRP